MSSTAFNCVSSLSTSSFAQVASNKSSSTQSGAFSTASQSVVYRIRRSSTCILYPPSNLDVTADFSTPAASGSFGEVFFGSLKNGEEVVLKRSRSSSDARALFTREREINALLRSWDANSHWPMYLGTFSRHSQTFLVWRRAGAGLTLEHFLSSCAKNALSDVLGTSSPAGAQLRISLFMRTMQQLLKAAVDLHERGIVHRDLKPDNILVVSATRQLQLIDFGSALDVRTPLWRRRAIHTIDPLYAAPETRVSLFAPDRFDVFSIALIGLRVLMADFSTAELNAFRTKLIAHDYSLVRYRRETNRNGFSGGAADEELRALFSTDDLSVSRIFDVLAAMLVKSPSDRITAERALASLSF